MPTYEFKLPDGRTVEIANASNSEAALRAFRSQFPEGAAPTDETQAAMPAEIPPAVEAPSQGFARGLVGAAGEGATLGLDDEIMSIIAAATAFPFVSDKTLKELMADPRNSLKTFKELMVDARNSLRADKERFAAENPKTALAANVAGGLTTGGIGATKAGVVAAAKEGGKAAVKAGAKFGAATGAVAGAGSSDSQEFLSVNTALGSALGAGAGAALGAALPFLAGKAGEAIKRRLNRPNLTVHNPDGSYTEEAIAVLKKAAESEEISPGEVDDLVLNAIKKNADVLSPEAAERFNLFTRRLITPTRANVSQLTEDFVQQQSALKRSGIVSEVVAKQDEQLTNLTRGGVDKISQRATDAMQTSANVFRVVDDVVTRADDAVNAAYAAARSQAAGQPRIRFDKLAEIVSSNRGTENASKGVITFIEGELKNRGIIKAASKLDVNKRGPRLRGAMTRKITVDEAEEVRKALNSLSDSVTPFGRRLIRKFKDAIDDDVASAVGEDIFKDARAAKSSFHKMIERGRRNKFDETRGGFLEDVIANKIPEEQIMPKLLSGRDDDLINFKEFLLHDAGEAGIDAWDDIRAQALRGALDDAIGTSGKAEGGQAVFNVNKFKNNINRIKKTTKYSHIFNGDERELIDDIIDIGTLRIPNTSAYLGRGATERAVDDARKEMVRREVLSKTGSVGKFAQGMLDTLMTARSDKRLLDVTSATDKALR